MHFRKQAHSKLFSISYMYRELSTNNLDRTEIDLSTAKVAMQLAIAALPLRAAFVAESVPTAATVIVKESISVSDRSITKKGKRVITYTTWLQPASSSTQCLHCKHCCHFHSFTHCKTSSSPNWHPIHGTWVF